MLDNLEWMISPKPQKIIWCYGTVQPQYDRDDLNIEFVRDISSNDLTPEALQHQPALLILDDVFTDLDDKFLYDLFTKTSHHSSLSVILILQFLFMKSKVMRVLSANSHVTTLFRSPRDLLSIRILNTYMYPRFVCELFHLLFIRSFVHSFILSIICSQVKRIFELVYGLCNFKIPVQLTHD